MSSRNAAFHDGPLAGVLLSPLKLAFSLALGLVALLLCAWIVDWAFVFKVWPQGIERLRELLVHDVAGGIALGARQGAGAGVITAPANALYSIVFEATGIHDMGTQFANGSALSIPDTIMRRSYVSHREGIEAARSARSCSACARRSWRGSRRCSCFCMRSAPPMGSPSARSAEPAEDASRPACTTGRRPAVGGAGAWAVALLMWPGPVQWELCAVLGALLTGGLASMQWAYYKKHM